MLEMSCGYRRLLPFKAIKDLLPSSHRHLRIGIELVYPVGFVRNYRMMDEVAEYVETLT